ESHRAGREDAGAVPGAAPGRGALPGARGLRADRLPPEELSMAARTLRVHVDNDPAGNDVFRVTPERFATAGKRFPAVVRRLAVTYGEGLAPDGGLQDAQVLITGHFPPVDLRALAPRLEWVQSTNAGVEDVLGILPPDVILTNASGVHGPKGAEFCLTALLML